jgi:hypothetical protein
MRSGVQGEYRGDFGRFLKSRRQPVALSAYLPTPSLFTFFDFVTSSTS